MEENKKKKKKRKEEEENNKHGSTTSQEAETNDLLSNENKNQSGVGLSGKRNRGGSSPLHDNGVPSQNQQYPQIFQWSGTSQPAMEQSPLISRPSISTQLPSPVVLGQWQQNPTSHQFQHSQPPLQIGQPTAPFWLPQQPGYQFAGVRHPASYQPCTPIGTTDASLQASGLAGGGTSLAHQPQVPNFGYHVGYPYSGFPGPWDPSSWWGQAQQSNPPSSYSFRGGCGHFPSSPLVLPGYSAISGQSSQRGIIQLPAKLSQKHQQLWEAQSAENVQLWAIIGHLQTELADYKNQLMKLETGVLTLKPKIEVAVAQGTGTSLPRPPSRRGRPKRPPVDPVNAFPSPHEPHPRASGRKAAPRKVQSENKSYIFEKVHLNKVDGKEKACQLSATTILQESDEKIANMFTNSKFNIENHGSSIPTMLAFHNQVPQDIHEVQQISRVGLGDGPNTSTNKNEDPKADFSILSKNVKVNTSKGASATFLGGTSNRGLVGWPSIITTPEASEDFYHNGSVISQGAKFVSGWNFANEGDGDASRGLEDAVVESEMEDDDDDDDDDVSSDNEEIARNEDVKAYNMDNYAAGGGGGDGSSGVPRLNCW